MWVSLLLCLGTCIGLAWYDSPSNTATMPAGEIGAVNAVGSRPDVEGWSGFESALLDINQIRVGMRVAAENPEVSDAERRTFVDPDSATWRFLKLRLPKSADPRDFVEIEMLRPVAWLEQHSAEAGGRVLLDLEELGAKGWAEVLEIGPCPEIVPGPGSVVTATFAHQPTSEILDVTISVGRQSPGGLTLDQPSSQDTSSPAGETIGVTANHPFWSVDHQAFVPVGHLEPGSRVKTHLDQIQTIVSLHPRPGPPEKVYNLEVHGEHVYYVGDDGALAHNSCANTEYVYVLYKDGKPVYVGSGTHARALGPDSPLHRIAKAKFGGDIKAAQQAGYAARAYRTGSEATARGMEQKLIDYFRGQGFALNNKKAGFRWGRAYTKNPESKATEIKNAYLVSARKASFYRKVGLC